MATTGTETSHQAHGHEAHGVDEFKKHIRGYWVVFFALLVLTGITVGVAEVGDAQGWGTFTTVAVALAVATLKASLVALYFMHLIDERKLIYWTLLLVAVLFVPLMFLPSMTDGEAGVHRMEIRIEKPADAHGSHGGGH